MVSTRERDVQTVPLGEKLYPLLPATLKVMGTASPLGLPPPPTPVLLEVLPGFSSLKVSGSTSPPQQAGVGCAQRGLVRTTGL